jgi:hypothetical protein
MSEAGQAERWYAALETIIRRYRLRDAAGAPVAGLTLSLDEALEACRSLRLTDGEAIRYLQPKGKR